MTSSIDQFLIAYEKEQDFYSRVAEESADLLERLLRAANIRAITSGRAKKLGSLRDKVESRDQQRRESGLAAFASVDEIRADIKDLAGARVAVYFPADMPTVNDLIAANFEAVEPPRVFPEAGTPKDGKRFAGYVATHHRVRLKPETLNVSDKRYCSAICEIQVASVLMHAWAEVEHDLEYKTPTGAVSPAESALLDQLNGLVIAGEIALAQLQAAMERRIRLRATTLRDHYDLANWLLTLESETGTARRAIGDVEFTYRFLWRAQLRGLAQLRRLEGTFRSRLQDDSESTLCQVLLDTLLADDSTRSGVLRAARLDMLAARRRGGAAAETDRGFTEFVARWQQVSTQAQIARVLVANTAHNRHQIPRLSELGVGRALQREFQALTAKRNALVHGAYEQDTQDAKEWLARLAAASDQITKQIYDHVFQHVKLVERPPHAAFGALRTTSAIACEDIGSVVLAAAVDWREGSRALAETRVQLDQVTHWPRFVVVEDGDHWRFLAWEKVGNRATVEDRFVAVFDVSSWVIEDARLRGMQNVQLWTTWKGDERDARLRQTVPLHFAGQVPS